MTRLVRELDDLVLDGRAIARADACDLAAVERGTRDSLAQDPPRFLGGIADVALDLRPIDLPGEEREWRRLGIAGLRLELAPVDGAAIEARRRSGLETGPVEAERAQLIAQQLRGRFPIPAAGVLHLADMRQAVQKSSGGDNHGAGLDGAAVAQLNARDAAVPNGKRRHFGLLDPKVGLLLENFAHADAVHLLIHLRARRPDGGAAAGVEKAELDADGVGELAHDAAEGVDLAHQVPLGDASDGGVARHLRDQVEVHGDHGGAETHARASAGGFAPGVTGADDHDVVTLVH